jgi:uncharacterized 2Fe-2S/4Fe-4S cluster protein (DUF4445 family)
VRIRIDPSGVEVSTVRGAPLLEQVRRSGIFVDASCGGEGRCGRCAFEPLEGEFTEPDPQERKQGKRLLCRGGALKDAGIRLTGSDRREAWYPFPPGVAPAGDLHLAVDLGTTTLSVAAGGDAGEPFVEIRTLNPQVAWGSDVLRRLSAASDPGEREAMREGIRKSVRALLSRLMKAGSFPEERVRTIGIAGNSAMILLFLGMDPASLATAPFQSPLEPMGTLGVDPALFGFSGPVEAFILPGIGSFVGSDVTAGLLASALAEGRRPALFLDAGTNGEIVLAPDRGPLLAASGAAGPAFEGGHLSIGGPGSRGAIYGVEIGRAGTVGLSVLGEGPPRWVCGSGVLELVAGLVEAGILREDGGFVKGAPGVVEEGGETGFDLGPSPTGALRFLQADVREVQLAVGALRAGWRILLDRAGLIPTDLRRIVVTGTFGKALDATASRRIGLLPSVDLEPETLPSGAVRGLLRAASGRVAREAWEGLVRETVHVPLGEGHFQEVFIDSLALKPYP